jgi:hypothetical protein
MLQNCLPAGLTLYINARNAMLSRAISSSYNMLTVASPFLPCSAHRERAQVGQRPERVSADFRRALQHQADRRLQAPSPIPASSYSGLPAEA